MLDYISQELSKFAVPEDGMCFQREVVISEVERDVIVVAEMMPKVVMQRDVDRISCRVEPKFWGGV